MTGQQMSIGDCDPSWDDLDRLCDLGAEELHDPITRDWRDLKGQRRPHGQRITRRQYHRIETIKPDRRYL